MSHHLRLNDSELPDDNRPGAKEVGPPWIFRPACCSQEKIHMQPVTGFNFQIHAAENSQGR